MNKLIAACLLPASRHANREAWRIFWSVMLKHFKRGNWHHRPSPVIAWRCAMSARWICLGCPRGRHPRYLRRIAAACLLPAVLSGCGLQGVGALLPVLEGGLGGLGGGGGSATLTLHIDQAHGDLTMGNPPAMTLVGTPINPGSPVTIVPAPPATPPVVVTPPPPTSGSPTPVPLPPISAPQPIPVVP